jgi:sterol desaturase/sphingolipid hydroxylase (fatty acid hydroxylase superfamily)
MDFAQALSTGLRDLLPQLAFLPLPLVPFFVAEQLRPVERRPSWRDYGLNVLISMSTAVLALPAGVAAGLWSARLREILPWPLPGLSLAGIGSLPCAGASLETLALTFIPLVVHDAWFYWAHRIEHRVPFLWEFHKLHHSDELMNASTFARDHFLQAVWITLFPVFTMGLVLDLSPIQSGKAALYSSLFLTLQSMLYHSAIRIRLRWLDRVLVTPQVHRIHHSPDPNHYNRNFSDSLPLFDILFGTYHRPGRDEFPSTGLGATQPVPRSLWVAQVAPVRAALRTLAARQP